jgi:carbonic anhydrase
VKGDKDLGDILKQNEEWIDEMKKEDPKFFDKLGAVHKPTYFWIGKFPGALP